MSRRLALVMLGDVMLGRLVDESLTALPEQRARCWGDVLPLLTGGMAAAGEGEAQLNIANLECCVTAETQKDTSRTFNFRLSPGNVAALTNARLDFVSLANNHCLDYREAGLAETQRVLSAAGIAFAGVGTPAAAARPAIVQRGGLRVALFSYADHFAHWAASEERPGINYVDPESFEPADIRRQLRQAREAGADLTVVAVHWGINYCWRPTQAIQRLARCFVDEGADVVFGHSAHHIQGIEVYKERPILYGTGAFIDDYRLDEGYRNDLSFLFCLHTEPAGRPSWLELVPTCIRHIRREAAAQPPYLSEVHLARGDDARLLRSRMRELSRQWGTRVEDAPGGRLRIAVQESE